MYDAAGQVTRVQTALGTPEQADEVTTTYRPNGGVETLTDGEGNRTTYEYDGHDRLAKTLYPVAAKGANASNPADYEELGYDPAGNVVSRRNRAGEVAGYTFDALSRVTLKDLPGSEPDVTYGYDLLGRMTAASQPGHLLAFSHDALGRLLAETGPRGTVSSAYDLAGRRTRLTYPDGYFVTHEHLVTGETSAIKESGATTLASFAYDDQGRRTLLTRGNGATTAYGYDPVSRLAQLSHDMAGTSGDVTFDYAYNPAGQIVTRTGSNDAYAWTGHGSGTAGDGHDGRNRITDRNGAAVAYDARGNLVSDGQDRVFGYSSENLLTGFARPSSGSPANPFGYDPLMRFVRNGPGTDYHQNHLYDPVADVIISKADPAGELTKFVHGPGQDEPLFALDYTGRRNWLHADERGSVIARSHGDGSLRRIVHYDGAGRPGALFDACQSRRPPAASRSVKGEHVMDLATRLVELEKRTAQHRELLLTEEAAKTALVLPFFQALGYDVFNPSEVIPEFTADVGIKKGEKVDYALCAEGKVNILVECKPSSIDLDLKHASQLFRYFSTTEARVAVLTNGVVYKFYSDTEQPNKMDEKPFFVFSLDTIKRSDPVTLERFTRNQFDIEAIIAEAGRLKLESQFRIEIEREFAQPSDDFVRLIAKRVTNTPFTAAVREHYQTILGNSIAQLIRDRVNDRLTSALHVANPEPEAIDAGASDDPSDPGDGVITTDDEMGGFRIVQAIAARHVDPKRVIIRDSKSYCAILLDDNNRKTLARLHFNSPTKRYVGTFEGKSEVRHPMSALTDIYQLEPQIVARLAELNGQSATGGDAD